MSVTSIVTDRFTFTGTRVTQPIMTKYERANVLGTRARQISMNFPVFVDVTGLQDEIDMASKELLAGKCPLIVRRIFPDHTPNNPHFEDWRVTELEMRSL